MKLPFGIELMKSKDFVNITKKLDEIEATSKIRPIQEAYSLFYQDGAVVPQYASDLQKRDMQELARISSVYRQVTFSLQCEIFRRGAEFKPKFVRKCTSALCQKEFETKLETCDQCGSETREPSYLGIVDAKKFFSKVNDNGQTLIDACKQTEFDLDTIDDMYLCLAKDYFFGADGRIVGGEMKEIFRIDPSLIFLVADKQLRPGRNEDGKRVFVCPIHRSKEIIEKDVCNCGKKAYPAFYKTLSASGGETIYYFEQEIIHLPKFSPSLAYGYPPFLSLYQKVMIELNMDWYVKKSYEKGRSPNSWVFVKTSNANSLQKAIEYLMEKLAINPHFSYPIGVPTDASGQFVQQVKMIDSMAEMGAVDYRNAIKKEIGALFGVMPLFEGDMSTSGGLNNEGLQVTVTNRAVEVGQAIYNEKVFPKIMRALGIDDYEYKLLPSEQKDEVAELQKQLLEKQNAKLMLDMGFNVALNEKKEFEFSGTASRQEPPNFGLPGTEAKTPSEQRFGGEPDGKRKSVAKARPPQASKDNLAQAARMEKTFEEELDELIKGMNWKIRPNKEELKRRVEKLVEKFGDKVKGNTHRLFETAYKRAMDEVEKDLPVNLVFGEQDKNAIKLLAESKPLREAYSGMGIGLSKKINEAIERAYLEPQKFTISKIVEEMKSAADEEEYRLRNIARTETTKVSNTARLNGYAQADKEGTYKFKWIGPDDSRTTETCKRIKERTKSGVSLDELKAIVTEEARKADPEFETNGLIGHYSCRHTFIKIVD